MDTCSLYVVYEICPGRMNRSGENQSPCFGDFEKPQPWSRPQSALQSHLFDLIFDTVMEMCIIYNVSKGELERIK